MTTEVKLNKSNHQISLVSVNQLKPYSRNAKLHPKKQVQQIANSIQQFGFITPIIVDESYEIIAGHGRFEAAQLLELKDVPVIQVKHLSDAEVKAYRLADNQLTLNSGYDQSLLRVELKELMSIEYDMDIELTGFEMAEIDLIIEGEPSGDSKEDTSDDIPEVGDEPAVTKPGNIWQLGQHRLICGDALDPLTYERLVQEDKAHMVFTDPPYNVPIDGHVCGLGQIKHKEFAMASGEMSESEFIEFLENFMEQITDSSVEGSLHYICMDWRHIYELLQAGKEYYQELKNICVWNKTNGGMGSLYRSKHELVAVFKHGSEPHTNNIQLGKYGRYRTNVWDYAGVNSFGKQQADLSMHPTVKPTALVMDAIKDCTKAKQIVLDPFAGSGTTLIACEKTKRIARCIELDPHYCDVIIKRWQLLTKQDAIHIAANETFDQRQQKMKAAQEANHQQSEESSPGNKADIKDQIPDQEVMDER